MKRLLIIGVSALLTVLMYTNFFNCKTFTYNNILHEDDIYERIDEYLRSSAANAHIPALTAAIANSDEILFAKAYGECESCDAPFVLGSVSKSFTAVCIMRLAEQGKINLNDRVSVYLKDIADGDRITVNQLLNHTSGLGEHQNLGNCHIVNEQGVHCYANVNYSLLGKIIEQVTGMTFEEYVTESIIEPLGLANTAASYEKSIANGLTDGHTDYWGFSVKSSPKYPVSDNAWITVPAGYISSSANDLARYLQMYLRGGEGIISQQSIGTMFYEDTVFVDDDVPFWYGYGWATVKDPLPEPVLRHSGLVETGTSCVFIIPGKDIAVAFTANVNDYFVTNEMMDSIGWGVILMLLGEDPNIIPRDAYILEHLRIDLIMLIVFAAAVIPMFFIPKYKKRVSRKHFISATASVLTVNIVFPVFILMIVPVFFKTPLWVAEAFVPDVFITVAVSSAVLFIGGIVKALILINAGIKSSA
ncbi:MAG: beta-lactamase family protein [Ruminiclostridium sp.]|nr:beta-lactamase family protein [Ruminiclostridium sp.]